MKTKNKCPNCTKADVKEAASHGVTIHPDLPWFGFGTQQAYEIARPWVIVGADRLYHTRRDIMRSYTEADMLDWLTVFDPELVVEYGYMVIDDPKMKAYLQQPKA